MKKHLASLAILFILWLWIVLVNYQGGILSGWDTIHVEFDFLLNIRRSLFAVWQEYQGVGLMGGMGHAADLPRQLILWAASLVIPTQFLRYAWTMGMLFLGVIGSYALTYSVLPRTKYTAMSSLIGAVFYLCNLVTVQTYFAPYEAFVAHYAGLPWLLWATLMFLRLPNKKTLFLFVLIQLVFMTQCYVPTLFLVFNIVMFTLSIFHIAYHKTKTAIKQVFILFVTIFFINAFWLMPFAYNTLTRGQVIVGGKINQMATEENFLKNQKYGTLADTLMLKNFWFDTAEFYPAEGKQELMLSRWKDHINTPFVSLLFGLISGGVIIGAFLLAKDKSSRAIVVIAGIGISMLASDTQPFSWIMEYLRTHIPFLSQFFRFPFTKWGVVVATCYAVFISAFAQWLIQNITHYRATLGKITPWVITGTILIMGFPIFQGNLIDRFMFVTIPDEYHQLFSYLKHAQTGRIANLPQPIFWDWKYYRWGQFGSGFLWYGIENPILDRAFDVWSAQNENYYWELSTALYSKDAERLESVFRKYDVKYILMDENVVSPSNNRSLFIDETKELLGTPTQTFGKLSLYEREGASFIRATSILPTVNSYAWTDNDVAYREVGDYITGDEIVYPFRSLFTKRAVNERDFTIEEDEKTISLLPLPFWRLFENILESKIQKDDQNKKECIRDAYFHIDIDPIRHIISKSTNIANPNDTIPSTTLKVKAIIPCEVSRENTNGNTTTEPIHAADKLVRNPDTTRYTEGNTLFFINSTVSESTASVNVIQKQESLVYDSTTTSDLNPQAVKPCGLLKNGKVTATTDNDYLRFTSLNQRGCLSFNIPNLEHKNGYLVTVEYRHIEGRPLMFSIINETAKHTELETYLSSNDGWRTDYFILPPLAPDGLGYNPYISNDSIGRHKSVNDLRSIKIYTIPYDELVTMKTGKIASPAQRDRNDIQVNHPNPAYYKISNVSGETLILSQAFDPGWLAYDATNRQFLDHVMVNNWENGWMLTGGKTVYIFFWPQLLEFLGFALLPIPFVWIWKIKEKKLTTPHGLVE